MSNQEIEYPIRINRYLYIKGYCSRRKADELIEKGLVFINGDKAVLGQKITENDVVGLAESIKEMPKNYEYFVFNKPKGVVSHSPQKGEKSVEDYFPKNKKVSFVGRLDKDSTGLMLMTNDGRIIEKMLNPKYEHEKEYRIRVDKELKESAINKMNKGVLIEGYKTKPALAKATGDKSFKIILTEGKKHQIRRMCAALGYQVQELKRTRIMNISMGNILPGQSRPLRQDEKIELLKNLRLM